MPFIFYFSLKAFVPLFINRIVALFNPDCCVFCYRFTILICYNLNSIILICQSRLFNRSLTIRCIFRSDFIAICITSSSFVKLNILSCCYTCLRVCKYRSLRFIFIIKNYILMFIIVVYNYSFLTINYTFLCIDNTVCIYTLKVLY